MSERAHDGSFDGRKQHHLYFVALKVITYGTALETRFEFSSTDAGSARLG